MSKDSMQHDNTTNYQPWKPSPLLEVEAEVEVQKVQLPTAEALEDIHRQAHEEGFEAGFAEGLEKGLTEGRGQGEAQVNDEIQRLQSMLATIEESMRELGKSTSEELLALSLEVARHILRQSLKVRPELLLPIVQGAMESIPQHSQHPQLYLHPEDAVLVKTHLQAEIAHGNWKVVEDQRIQRGGCRIETSAAQMDATLETRWQRLVAALGSDISWLGDDGTH